MDRPRASLTSDRSVRKRDAIAAAARATFLAKGYAGTSMDEIAALAEVSKRTIYNHFADKDQLFTEIVTADIADADRGTQAMLAALSSTDDIERDLREFARRHIAEVTAPHLVRMRRMIIGEADRFPELARHWYLKAPHQAHLTFAECFTKLAERGLLHVDDPLLAAQNFNWLVLSIPLNRAMFNADDGVSAQDLERYADEAVRVFLAGYAAG